VCVQQVKNEHTFVTHDCREIGLDISTSKQLFIKVLL